jgi:hypothetical protein
MITGKKRKRSEFEEGEDTEFDKGGEYEKDEKDDDIEIISIKKRKVENGEVVLKNKRKRTRCKFNN